MVNQTGKILVCNFLKNHKSGSNQRTKFTLYNLAGQEKYYYLVDKYQIKEIYQVLDSTTATSVAEPLAKEYTYQVFFSRIAKQIYGTHKTLKLYGVKPEDEGIIYKYQLITKDVYHQLRDVPIAQNHESVYAFAKANLAEGNLNIAKYAIASTLNATLIEKHAKALTSQDIAKFAQDIDSILFYPNSLQKYEILDYVQVNHKISVLELIKIFEEHRNNIIINIKHLQDNYQRKSIKRIAGIRDENEELIKPWLQTEYIDDSEYIGMGVFELNRNTATINLLVNRKIKLVKLEDTTPILEVAGLLTNDLASFNNYTIVSDGQINIKALKVKISNQKTFKLLKEKGVIEAEEFDFRSAYIIQLDTLPLVPIDKNYSSIDGLFSQLAEIKVLASIIYAHLKGESDTFVPAQLDDLKSHCLSNNIYTNFPTTNEYTNIKQALVSGIICSRVSYKIDIGSQDIINFSKLHSANKFLNRMYRAYDKETGEIFTKPNLRMVSDENIGFRHKLLSSRTKITKVDELMKPIFDDFLGLRPNGTVANILTKVSADSLVQILQDKQDGKQVSKEEMVTVLTAASTKLEQYINQIYQEKISPLVFYIGATGLLPNNMVTKAMNAEEIAAKYPDLQFSKNEQTGTFFVVGDSIISVYGKTEYYSKKLAIGVEK